MRIFLYFLVCLLLISSSLANPVLIPIIAGGADDNQGSEATGCFPPIDFSIENSCTLSKYDRFSINKYNCRVEEGPNYIVLGDCKGGVISYDRLNYDTDRIIIISSVVGFVFLMILMGFLFWYFIFKNKDDDEDDEDEKGEKYY